MLHGSGKDHAYATPKGFGQETNAYSYDETKSVPVTPTQNTVGGDNVDAHNDKRSTYYGNAPANTPYRKRLYSHVVAAPPPSIHETDSSFSRYPPLNPYTSGVASAPPPPYDYGRPRAAIPAQHVQHRYHYEEPIDPYMSSYNETYPPLKISSPMGKASRYQHEVFHRQTPSDFHEIQPTLERKRSFWRRHPVPMFTFLFGFLFPPLWIVGMLWYVSRHRSNKRWAIVNGVGVIASLIAVIVIESYHIAGKL
ncbi:hypothetical protein BDF22DRAFT_746586 [Syncephalis plumigaleata]|nr:hypothetical protein BDF22DRAFT_746586 [Syncephalis plumigaleata]